MSKAVTRSRSLLASPEAAEMNTNLMTFILFLITVTEGADNALFASVSLGLVQMYNFFDFNILTTFSTFQGITGAVAGPFWGIIASRGTIPRRTILIGGTMLQGLATLAMVVVPDLFEDDEKNAPRSRGVWTMLALMAMLRMINAIALAALRPIATSIIADTFSEEERGKRFGMLAAGLNIGGGVFGVIATTVQFFDGDKVKPLGFLPIAGWKFAFIVVGVFTCTLAPLCYALLTPPSVKVDEEKLKAGAMGEIRTLGKLMLQTQTFAILVVQGCFGLIPWKAFEFRVPFIILSGVSEFQAGIANMAGQFTGAVGAFIGGAVGDGLGNNLHPLHGRILTAEISVYGGIPIAFLNFQTTPWGEPGDSLRFFFFLVLSIALALVATWPGPGCNAPVLCNVCKESERSLVLAWQISLESAIGSFGPVIFGQLLNVLGYNDECLSQDFKDEQEVCFNTSDDTSECFNCDNAPLMGRALFWTSCVPWGVCGFFYTTLHYFYPRDFAKMAAVLEAEDSELGAPLDTQGS